MTARYKVGRSSANPWVLGLSASHNGACCLLHGRRIVAAIQEERLSGIKRQRTYGSRHQLAIQYCLDAGGIRAPDLGIIVISVQGNSSHVRQDVSLNSQLRSGFNKVPVHVVGHHKAHAISAFVTSGFERSVVMVADGAGSPYDDLDESEKQSVRGEERGAESISVYVADRAEIKPLHKQLSPLEGHLCRRPGKMATFRSLGGLFSSAALQIFGEESEAGKVMGLAPYGSAEIPIEDFLRFEDGLISFSTDAPDRIEACDRWPAEAGAHATLAASAQKALEYALLNLARYARGISQEEFLCMAGGVALNSIANDVIVRQSGFRDVHIIPAAEDSGVAIGAAYHGLHVLTGALEGTRLIHDSMGVRYSAAAIDRAARATPSAEEILGLDPATAVAKELADGKVVAWFQGGSELGPRALGQRSILFDPRRADAKEILNSKVKHREAFRPFAPAVLEEHATNWFELEGITSSPFMLRICQIRAPNAALVPGIAHIDNSARPQTVSRQAAPKFHELITAFYALTGVPILINTSLNVMGEPIVETPDDALWCLVSTGVDVCVIDGRIFRRSRTDSHVLDLVPSLKLSSVAVEYDLCEKTNLVGAALRSMTFIVQTPWGDIARNVTGECSHLAATLNGVKTGREIMTELLAQGLLDPVRAERSVVCALGQLRRLGIVRFTERPEPWSSPEFRTDC
jgi:carbamoyltransferase